MITEKMLRKIEADIGGKVRAWIEPARTSGVYLIIQCETYATQHYIHHNCLKSKALCKDIVCGATATFKQHVKRIAEGHNMWTR